MRKNVFLLAILFLSQFVYGQQAGELDPTFGTNGIVQTPLSDDDFLVDAMRNLLVQPDGKILAMGSSRHGLQKQAAYVRYNQDGSLDTSFGDEGKLLVLPTQYYGNFAMDAKVLSDNKIISCGYIFDDTTEATSIFLLKMDNNGVLDSSFGDNGIVLGEFAGGIVVEQMVCQKDGKILLAGYFDDQMAAVRYNADGSIDESFGQNGLSVISFEGSPGVSYASDIVIQDDGKILVSGYYPEGQMMKWVVARLLEDGSLDPTFGEEGVSKISLGYGHDFLLGVRLQKDGKIILAGHSWDTNYPVLQYSVAVVRLNTDGTMDTSFGESGSFRKQFLESGENYLSAMTLSPEGKIYGNLSLSTGGKYDIGVFCLDSNGHLDPTFGVGGYTITDIDGADEDAIGIDLQQDGKVVVGAVSFSSVGSPFTVLRYNGNYSTGLIALEDNGSFSVYPNVVNDILNIEYYGDDYKVQVFDAAGRMVLNSANPQSLNVVGLAAGNYFIKLIDGQKVLTSRFIKL